MEFPPNHPSITNPLRSLMKNTLKHAAAIALFAGAVFTARAQVAATYNDLLIGFSDGTTSLEVDLGNINQFTGANGLGIAGTLSLGNVSSALLSTYGSDLSGVSWGIAGTSLTAVAPTNTQPAKTSWISAAWGTSAGTLGTQNSTAWGSYSTSSQGNANTAIAKLYTGMQQATVGQTLNSTTVKLTGTSNTFLGGVTTAAAFSIYNPVSTFLNGVTNYAAGKTYSASDLYAIVPSNKGSNVFMGTFALSSAGALSFTGSATAVPEPSTYAAILGAAGLGLVLLRRRKSALQTAA
jgi:hypothetical protein